MKMWLSGLVSHGAQYSACVWPDTRQSPHAIAYGSTYATDNDHRKTFTVFTENDRTLTINELAKMAKNKQGSEFGKYFRSPGHVTLLRAAEGLLLKRKGHTEMSVALAEMCELTQVAVCCEMMDDATGDSLPTDEVENYAEKEGLVFLSGAEVIEAYQEFKKD